MKKIIKNTFILTVITLVAGVLLGLVYEITKEPIKIAKEEIKSNAYRAVMKEAEMFEEYNEFDTKKASKVLSEEKIPGCVVNEVVEAKKGSDVIGYVITVTTSEGYGGDIQISVGILADGNVQGVEILSIGETAGLGMNANTPGFKKQYVDKKVESFVVTKTGASAENEIEAISGATITSKAVTNAVNAAVVYFNSIVGGGSGNE